MSYLSSQKSTEIYAKFRKFFATFAKVKSH